MREREQEPRKGAGPTHDSVVAWGGGVFVVVCGGVGGAGAGVVVIVVVVHVDFP